MNRRILIFIVLSGLLVSCETISFINIEVKRPAEIIIPANVRKVVVVNNSVSQPDNYGHTAFSFQKKIENPSIKTDALSDLFISDLAERINDKRLFKVFKQTFLPEKTFQEDTALSKYQMKATADSTGADLVISLDRFLLESILRIRYLQSESLYRMTMDAKCQSTIRVYALKDQKVLYTFRQQDTLFWENYDLTSDQAIAKFPSPSSCLEDMTKYHVERILKKLYPYDETVQRFYYVGRSQNMKDAAVYLKHNKWLEAFYIWDYLYNNEKSKRLKAYCAANIALYYEICDQFDQAIKWAELSKDKFQTLNSEKSEVDRLDQYIKDLNVRQLQVKLLDKQIQQ